MADLPIADCRLKAFLLSVVMGPWSVAINYRRATHDRGMSGRRHGSQPDGFM
jgi:hypothetical protein